MYDKVLTGYIFMCGVPLRSKSMDADADTDGDTDSDSRFNYASINLLISKT